MSYAKLIKCVLGMVVALGLSMGLPFFDGLPWNVPAYRKRAVVKESLQQLASHPDVTMAQYRELSRDGQTREIDETLDRLEKVYPSPLAMICQVIRRKAQWRAWGLLAVEVCAPRGTLQGKYAPPLPPLIKWLDDQSPIVASNALGVLQAYAVLPPEDFVAGGLHAGKILTTPAAWRPVYDAWYRRDKPSWHMVKGRYYSERNWPTMYE